ncbi:hypothetical protein CYMTET_46862 [Cymbomonas tetramitiformis]|uniref:Uncharacterized protein n=1 Tax=Cymbomonas tetramitiformis TaxID=36881 RepID=A0AAE0EWR0_9CHLO|nr:hypothetical protein CYMTET_46862 [Cymbomonas tetramitiformis]
MLCETYILKPKGMAWTHPAGGKVKKWSAITDCLQVRGNALQRVGPSLALPHGTAPALLFHCSACFTSEDMTALALAGLPPCSTD